MSAPPKVPLFLLALFMLSGTLAMHIFVPALPYAAADLNASAAALQMTVSLYIFGLALGQLFYGPLSDRFGRRPVLMAGLVLYIAAGLAAALAPTAPALIAARLLQALGGCAGVVLGRAIVRDTAAPTEAARRLALLNLLVTAGPSVAPLAGSLFASALGWRSIFYALCALGAANFLLALRLLPETNKTAQAIDVRTLMRHYRLLAVSPKFLGFAIGGGCATTSMYAFVASAPFIFAGQLNRPPHEAGIYLALIVSGLWLGSGLASRLVARVALTPLLLGANLLSVAASLVFLGAVLSATLSVPLIVCSMFVLTVGIGIAAPATLTQSISVNPQIIGSAAGLYGFIQMAVGALCTAFAGMGKDPALSAGIVLVGAGVLSQAGFWIAARIR